MILVLRTIIKPGSSPGLTLLLWYLTPFSATFQLHRDVSFIGGGNRNTRVKPQVTGKLYHMMLYRVHLAMGGIRTHNISV